MLIYLTYLSLSQKINLMLITRLSSIMIKNTSEKYIKINYNN
jgi:hypothetical protein